MYYQKTRHCSFKNIVAVFLNSHDSFFIPEILGLTKLTVLFIDLSLNSIINSTFDPFSIFFFSFYRHNFSWVFFSYLKNISLSYLKLAKLFNKILLLLA